MERTLHSLTADEFERLQRRLGLNVVEFAAALDVDVPTLRRWLRARELADPAAVERARRLAQARGVWPGPGDRGQDRR